MASAKLSVTEIAVLFFIALSIAVGLYLVYTNVPLFERYTAEDGIYIEWPTVIGLLLSAFVCFSRVWRGWGVKSRVFLLVAFLMGVVLVFGAGEEISWGQRLLGIESPEYFKEHNAQGETNIHNLVLGGVRLNRWIFSIFLTLVLAVYIGLVPFLYKRKQWMRRLVNYWGLPLPRPYQIVAVLVVLGTTELMPHGKRAEVSEAGIALILFLIIAFPLNKESFTLRKIAAAHS